jgi:hypothetical protein
LCIIAVIAFYRDEVLISIKVENNLFISKKKFNFAN